MRSARWGSTMKESISASIERIFVDTATREVTLSFLRRKIEKAGIKAPSKRFLNKLLAYIKSERDVEFTLPKKYERLEDPDFFISDVDDDLFVQQLSDKIAVAQKRKLKKLIKKDPIRFLKIIENKWHQQRAFECKMTEGFERRLEKRWGKAFNKLRILLSICREIGAEKYNAYEISEEPKSKKIEALLRLHIRSCQITSEVIALMEGGYADGAMARWRTLHEVETVATLIKKHDDELAERYLAHDAVETKKAADLYQSNHVKLGFEPIPVQEMDHINKKYSEVVTKYGPEFKEEYGWAAKHISNKRPNFFGLLDALGEKHMKSYYKMASYNVHAGTRGIGFKLGALDGHSPALAGASNAGFEEPLQNTALSLVQLTSLLLRPVDLDHAIQLAILVKLKDRAINAVIVAGRRLKTEHRIYLENLAIRQRGKFSSK
jgi:hypothetical protein